MAEIFLSYAREDRARAEQVAQNLEAAGLPVFWDNEIPPGTTWADFIEAKLAQCKALIVLWSEHSTKSQWVREEARLGRDKGVLIPVAIDAAPPPFGFGEVQAANLAAWSGDTSDPHWRRFVDAVRALSAAEPRMPPPQAQPSPAASHAAASSGWSSAPQLKPIVEKRKLPVWAWVVGAVVATVAVLAIIGSMMPNQGQQSQAAANGAAMQPPAQSQQAQISPQSQQILLQQLQQGEQVAAQQGFQQVGQPFAGGLIQGQSWNVPAQLVAGYDYRVLGVCDQNCRDLDLSVFDESGATVAQDNAADDHPVASVTPAANGAYTIQAQMYQCTGQPCFYAVVLYQRARQ